MLAQVFSVPSGMSAKAVARRCLWLAFCQSRAVGLGVLHMPAANLLTEDDFEKKHLLEQVNEYVSDYIAGRMVKLTVKYDEEKGLVSMRDEFRPDYQSFAPSYPTPLHLFNAATSSIHHEATGVSVKQEASSEDDPACDVATHPLMQFFKGEFDKVEKIVAGFPSRLEAALHFWNHKLMSEARKEFCVPCGRAGCDCADIKSAGFDKAVKDGVIERYIRANPEPIITVMKYRSICKYVAVAKFICTTLAATNKFAAVYLKKSMNPILGKPFCWGMTIETNGNDAEQKQSYADIDYILGSIGIGSEQWEK